MNKTNKNTHIHIIGGTGKMGKWLKLFLYNKGFSITVSNSKNTDKNVNLQKADVVVFSVPIYLAPGVIKQFANKTKKDALLIDTSSIVDQSEKALLKSRHPFLNMHLLFGPSIRDLKDQRIVFIKQPKPHAFVSLLKEMLKDNGARIYELTNKEHDNYCARTQALIHFINLMLLEEMLDSKIEMPPKISTPVFRSQYALMLRVLFMNSANLNSEIEIFNPYFAEVLKKFIDKQSSVLSLIQKKNKLGLEARYTKIKKIIKPPIIQHNIDNNESILPGFLKQKNQSIAYLGPQGTYSYHAAQKIFNDFDSKFVACNTLYDIFESVSDMNTDIGVVPAENSSEGMVRETIDYLVDFDLKVNLSIDLPIHHYLISNEKNITDIKKIIAHPQSLAQCRKWIRNQLKDVQVETADSNLAGMSKMKNEKGIAMIGPKITAKKYKLNILSENIQDYPDNTTRFYVITRKIDYSGAKKSLLFVTVLNRVGVLRDILNVFADFGINLSRLESRPSWEKNWDYCFFVEVDKNPSNPTLHQAMDSLRQYTESVAIIGGI